MFRRFLLHKAIGDKDLLLILPKPPLFPRLLLGTFVGNVNLERITATEARAGQIVQGKGIDYREKTFNHGDHNEHKEDNAGRRNEQVGCVVKTHRDAERCVIASSAHPTNYRLQALAPFY